MKNVVVEIVLWIVVGSLVVLAIMNPKGFTAAVSSIGGLVMGESKILTGSGYQQAA